MMVDDNKNGDVGAEKLQGLFRKHWNFGLTDLMLLCVIAGLLGILYGLYYGQSWCYSVMDDNVERLLEARLHNELAQPQPQNWNGFNPALGANITIGGMNESGLNSG